jgi:hypothetical protein
MLPGHGRTRWLIPGRAWRPTGRSGLARTAAGCLRPSSPSRPTRPLWPARAGRRCTSTDQSPTGPCGPARLTSTCCRSVSTTRLPPGGCCRRGTPACAGGVEIAAAEAEDLAGDSDAAYGFRVFLRHYCIHLAGPDPSAWLPAFPADTRAARGFNGDIARHCRRWRQELGSGTVPADLLGVRAARKTLLAVAGLVSVCDRTWTTDRARAARRWGEIEPGTAAPLRRLLSWATPPRTRGSPACSRERGHRRHGC